tara:strand:+ start:646 stop:3774 length:3129 start_codon:yes stop_codon:yes gene_type:complete
MSISNNILTNNNMSYNYLLQKQEVIDVWNNDPSADKPSKLFTKTGKPLKKAIKYNKDLIKAGKTSSFIERGYAYNASTNKTTNILTKTGKLKKIKDKEIFKGTIGSKGDIYKLTARNPQNDPYAWTDDNNNNLNYWLLKNLMEGRTGDYRIMINIDGQNIFDRNYTDVDENWWKDNQIDFETGGSPKTFIWQTNENGVSWQEGTPITIIITRESRIPTVYYEQKYKQGKTNCLLTPIHNFYIEKMSSVKTKSAVANNAKKVQRLVELQEKYIDGVPESALENICDELQIGIAITQPFSNKKYVDLKSMKRPLKNFNFINSAPDHLDIIKPRSGSQFKGQTIDQSGFVKDFDPIEVEQEELNKLVEEAINSDMFYVYTKHHQGYSSLRTLTEYYKLPNKFWETAIAFEKETQLEWVGFDALKYPHLADFVNQGTHFNGTVDFIDTTHLEYISKDDKPPEDIEHIDMKSAYANFNRSKYYSGFCGKICAFRKTTKAIYNGLYYIDNLDFSIADPHFVQLNDVLGWFYNENIYTKQELDCLTDMNVKYDVKYGAYSLDRFDFEFSDDMLNKIDVIERGGGLKPIKVPYYSKYCGVCASVKPYTNYFVEGRKKWLQTIHQDEHLQIYQNDFDNETRIAFVKKALYTKKHITAQITAYQRLQVLEQLLKMDFDKIIRVCTDGIYSYKHNYKNKEDVYSTDQEGKYNNPLWRPKGQMTFQNKPCDDYLSNIIYDTEQFELLKKENWIKNVGEDRTDYKHEFFAGAGGTGKTTINIYDKGLIHPVYVAPTWKLATDMQKEYKKKTGHCLSATVLHRITHSPYCDVQGYMYRWANYIIDEASMISEGEKKMCLKNLSKTIFMGDLDYQLPPVFGTAPKEGCDKDFWRKMNLEGFDNVQTFTEVHRFKCDKLKEVAEIVRDRIKENYDYKTLPYFQHITIDKVKDLYKKEDMILASENQYNKEYCEMFADIPKYRVKSNFTQYKNGEIIFEDLDIIPKKDKEFRHAFTVHSVQGLTFEHNIFIDLRRLQLNRMFYTAISRAKKIEQIYLII